MAVSCRLPYSPGRTKERKEKWALEYSSYVFKSIRFLGGTWQYYCQKRPLKWVGKKGSLSKLEHVRVQPYYFKYPVFPDPQDTSGCRFWDQEKGASAGFPMHGFIRCRSTTNRFPQLIYYPCLLYCMQNFPLVDYVSWSLSHATNTNIL